MTNGFPYILLADDDSDDLDFFYEGMHRRYPQVGIRAFKDGEELLDFLNNCTLTILPACMLIDYKMPRFGAPQVLQATGPGTCYARVPKMVWSNSERKGVKDECFKLGAAFFVAKPATNYQLDRLIDFLEQWLVKPLIAIS